MAARFPVSATAVAYQIKSAWSSKIKAIFWPAGADSLHMLRPGDTTTTIVTRSASGATYNSTEGRIEGTASAPFAVEVSGGLGVNENTSALCFGMSVYGDAFNFAPANGICTVLGSADADPTSNTNGLGIYAKSYEIAARVQNNPGYSINAPMGNDVASLVAYCIRHDQADATAKFRVWVSENGATGAETTGFRQNPTAPSSSTAIGGTGRPLYVGQTKTIGGNTKVDFESAWLAVGLSDTDMAAITTNPADLIEPASSSETITLTPDPASVQVGGTRTFTATRSAAAGAGGVTYNVSSNNPAVATVPTPQTLTEADSDLTFDATGVSVGTANITITNAADSNETDTVALTVTAVTTKKCKFLVHPDFASATGITIEVNEAPSGGALTGAKLGFATGIAAESTLEAGQAVIKVNAADVGAAALAAATSVRAIFKGLAASGSALGSGAEAGSVVVATGTIIEE